MRIIHKYSPGCPWTNMIKCGDNPVGSFIGGMFGLAGTESTNETNEDIADYQLAVQMAENQKNRDYNTVEAEKARNFEAQQAQIGRAFTTSEREAQQQWQQSQWEYQQKNQLPLQMLGARNAGVNPNVAAAKMMSAQGGSVSAPTGASSPMPGSPVASFSGGLSPIPYQAVNPAIAFAQAAQGLASLATAKEKGANVSLIEKQVQNMAVDTQYKQVLTDGLRLTQALQKIDLKYHEKKLVQDLAEQIARTTSLNNAAALSAATAKIQDSIKRLNEALLGKHTQESTLLALEVGTFDKRLSQQLKLQSAEIAKANADAFKAAQEGKVAKNQVALSNIEIEKNEATKAAQIEKILKEMASGGVQSDAAREKAQTELRRWEQLNKNDKNAVANWINHTLWFVKQNIEGIAFLLPLGKK